MVIAFVVFLLCLLVFLILKSDGPPSRTIYSSLPQRMPGGARDKQTADMERAIKLALEEADGKAGKFKVEYEALDASNDDGEFESERVRANARRAAGDSDTAVYIGDRTSGASIESIPILSRASVPQISPASTRVGLTIEDPTGDADEPRKYYPAGYRNFVRVIPNDNVQAAALVALMKRDGCKRVAMINDGGDYGAGLSNNQTVFERPKRVFRQSVRPNAAAAIYDALARQAKVKQADCFQYAGSSNPNTVAIFRAFAEAVPGIRLYATDGVSESSFTDTGDASCVDLNLMVPPRDLDAYPGFLDRFTAAHPEIKDPDPYAIYAYEAMRLALDAIERSPNGKPDKILERLRETMDRPSLLGTYSIDDDGDTTLVDYDVERIRACRPADPRRAVSKDELQKTLRVLKQRLPTP